MKTDRMTLQRILALCMTVIMISVTLSSCNKGKSSAPSGDQPTADSSSQYKADYLPEEDYDGYTYRILEYDNNPKHISEDPENIVDEAIYKRNKLIEAQYNIEFEAKTMPYSTWWDVRPIVSHMASSEDAQYELVTITFQDAYSEVIAGNVPVASSLPIIDMSQPWHNRILNDSVTVDGVTLLDFTSFDVNPGGCCIIFNETLVKQFNLTDPYTLVKEGKWTYDEMYKMASAGKADLDNDDQWTEGDRYGIISAWDIMTLLSYWGTGERLITTDNGEFAQNRSEALISSFLYAVEKLKPEGMIFDPFAAYGRTEASRIKGAEKFMNGGSMLLIGTTDNVKLFGDMEDDYGILPYPKWSEDQKDHLTPYSGEISLPLAFHPDLEMVCVIKEALAVETLNIYTPAYFENFIQNRYLRHEVDLEMLQIITDGCSNDFGRMPWYGYMVSPLEPVLSSFSTNFASKMEANSSKVQLKIDELMSFIQGVKSGE